jgi:hypothetical protein
MVDDVGPYTAQRVRICVAEPFEACVGQRRRHPAGVLGGLLALDQSLALHPLDQPGDAAGGQRRFHRQLVHPHRPAWRLRQVNQHDVLGQAKAAAGEQVGVQRPRYHQYGPCDRAPGGFLVAVEGSRPSLWCSHGGGLGDIAGPENLAGLLRSFIGALPDLYAAEQDIIAENDLVLVRLVVTATVKGSLLGVAADGKPVRWNAYDVYRITDGKISEEWAGDDLAAIMAQIGAFNPPWGG